MKKILRYNVQARKVKQKAALVKGDLPTELTATVIPSGSVIEWAGSRRSNPRELNVVWNGDMYAIRREQWDGGEDIEEDDEQQPVKQQQPAAPKFIWLSVQEVEEWLDLGLPAEELRAKLKAKLPPKQ